MATTPTSKFKLSCKEFKSKTSFRLENEFDTCPPSVTDTPLSKNNQADRENDYSPIYFPLTQETNEDIDVLWDWHSPQSSQKRRKKQKRLLPVQSPKFPMKRYPSNNQNQNFERLHNELKALQEELALPDDESCLCVSPLQELEVKDVEANNLVLEEPEHRYDEVNDLFNDSMDEQLLLFSQQLETETTDGTNLCGKQKQSNFTTNICNSTEIDNLINRYSEKNNDEIKNLSLGDSFSTALSTFDSDDLTFNVNTPKNRKLPLQRTISDNYFDESRRNVIQTVSGKLEFHRTKSFEQSRITGQGNFTKCSLEEIERKRLEALARLESKKKQESSVNSFSKCSPEEIENKRLQALAKLEAKRLQDIVEKKRQEALKKLQISRLKNASQVRSTLTERL